MVLFIKDYNQSLFNRNYHNTTNNYQKQKSRSLKKFTYHIAVLIFIMLSIIPIVYFIVRYILIRLTLIVYRDIGSNFDAVEFLFNISIVFLKRDYQNSSEAFPNTVFFYYRSSKYKYDI